MLRLIFVFPSSWFSTCSLRLHWTLQTVEFCDILQFSQNAAFPFIVTFFIQWQHELYLLMLLISRIHMVISLEVEISSSVGSDVVEGSTSFIVHSVYCLCVLRYFWSAFPFILSLLKKWVQLCFRYSVWLPQRTIFMVPEGFVMYLSCFFYSIPSIRTFFLPPK